jgi:hypothetical protein
MMKHEAVWYVWYVVCYSDIVLEQQDIIVSLYRYTGSGGDRGHERCRTFQCLAKID